MSILSQFRTTVKLMPQPAGRYAPSPSGDLHLGNFRTAVLAWLFARRSGRRFVLRVEDIDTQRSHSEYAQRQLEDLASIGLTWDEVLYQHDRFAAYEQALKKLPTYECYCSRKDIQEASRAPHAIPGHYPGTCRDLSDEEREGRRQALAAQHRVPAIRLRATVSTFPVEDYFAGTSQGEVDDMILRRGGHDPDWAYNLAVVVDDGYQGVDQIVRGDDLLPSTARQNYLAHLLGLPIPEYVHVPLVLNAEGKRLAKRDGAVTLREVEPAAAVEWIAHSVGSSAKTVDELLETFDPLQLPRHPVTWS